MRIVFMGTPDFAVSSLAALYNSGYEICGVYTQPDKARNRGMKITFSPVKEYALSKGLTVYQPHKLRDGQVAYEINALKPDIIVVVAYGRILPEEILKIPPLGAINVHASLLPQYRGAAPIQWSVINGDEKTGVTTMYMAPKLDAGDIIGKSETKIDRDETFGELHDKLADMGARLLIKTLEGINKGGAIAQPQDESLATYAPPIKKSHCILNWEMPAEDIVNRIRGLNPSPGARTSFGGTDFKIYKAERTDIKSNMKAGKIISADDEGLLVACGNGETVLITELQAAGRKRMSVADYLRGHKLEN